MSDTGESPPARQADAAVDALFTGRWSPRSYLSEPLGEDETASLFEAARWSPSASNRQPWLFLYETDGPERALFDSILLEGNRVWAQQAPLLMFLFARVRTAEGKKIGTAAFDCGAAWMSLALQARLLGLYTHGMAGIDRAAAHEKLGVDDQDFSVMCAIAAGRIGPRDALPEDYRKIEQPNQRMPRGQFAQRGVYKASR